MISWNGAAEKYDIRDWASEHEKMGKGITFERLRKAILPDFRPEK